MVILLLRNLHWYLQLAAGSRHSGRRVLPTQLDQVESIETIRWCADLPRLPRVRISSRPKPAPNPRLSIPLFGHPFVAHLKRTLGQRHGCVLQA
jgi:hypothetical protein